MTEITLDAADGGSFGAYLALPKAAKGPGILCIQEIFGVNPAMRTLADSFAAQGYVALCPDLFWRQEPGVQLDPTADWDHAVKLMQGFDVDQGIEDLKVALAALRHHPACTGKTGSVGYCLGGKLAYLMGARSDADANVGYYGVYIQNSLDEAKAISHPLLLHIAEKDQFVPRGAQERIKTALAAVPGAETHSYPGVNHAFARPGGDAYDAAAAELANRRSAEFLRRHLGG